ncbi:MAG: dihydroorotate dehydrogenase electron transfer subunit [Chloroflexota bacterium]
MINIPKVATITRIIQENYRTKTIEFDVSVDAVPGQFIMVWLPQFDEKPFSLVHDDPLTLMVTAVGPFSHLLHQRKLGDSVWIRGPFGRGFQWGPQQRSIALVGGGYGVAPLYWLARQATGGASDVKLDNIVSIIGARHAKDILYSDRFSTLYSAPFVNNRMIASRQDSKNLTVPAVQLHITTEDGSRGVQGQVTDILEPMLAHGDIDGIYACGPDGMLAAIEELAVRYHVAGQLSWEAYMRCAVGICGACEHYGQVLCMDGPVLSVNRS